METGRNHFEVQVQYREDRTRNSAGELWERSRGISADQYNLVVSKAFVHFVHCRRGAGNRGISESGNLGTLCWDLSISRIKRLAFLPRKVPRTVDLSGWRESISRGPL